MPATPRSGRVRSAGARQHKDGGVAACRHSVADGLHDLFERSLFDLSIEDYEIERLRVSDFNRVFGRRYLDDLELLAVENRRERLERTPADPSHQHQSFFLQHASGTTFTDSHIHYTA